MSRRAATWLAWTLFGVYSALLIVTLWLVWRGASREPDYWSGLLLIGYATVGALVAARRPGNAVGWLLLAVALAMALGTFCEVYGLTPTYPGRLAAAWFAGWAWYLWLCLAGVFLALVFPTGRLLSRRWRPAAWLGAVGLAGCIVGAAFKPGELAVSGPVDNPLGAPGTAGDMFGIVENVGFACVALSLVLAGLSIVLRFRWARGTERQQLKWFSVAGLVMVAGIVVSTMSLPFERGWGEVLGSVGWSMFLLAFIVGIPVATGIAILQHRLYDIDVVINRTLVYGSLTAILAATYLASVLVLRLVLGPVIGESDLAVAGSTLAVAALVRPLRSRIQTTVDRRFYRARYDASRTLEAFTRRLRDQIDLEALGTDLRTVVRDTVQPAHVSLWLRGVSR
jgi:hypothetical protein